MARESAANAVSILLGMAEGITLPPIPVERTRQNGTPDAVGTAPALCQYGPGKVLPYRHNTKESVAPSLPMRRPDISDRLLIGLVIGIVVCIAIYAGVRPWLPQTWKTPGSPPLYLLGVAGAALLLVSMAFVIAKRTGRGGSPVAWFVGHILAASIGTVLIVIHSGGFLRRPPALLFLVLAALIVLGLWARVRGSRRIAATFATKHQSFRPLDAGKRARLEAIIKEKTALLHRLDPEANEGTFSVTLRHWLRRPFLAYAYARLTQEERRLLGTRRMVPPEQAYWRPLHLALAYLFVAGLLIHVITVTFFAGYVADYGEIYWWHLTDW